MIYIGQRTLSPSEARQLENDGFIVKFVMMHLDGTDTFEVYAKA